MVPYFFKKSDIGLQKNEKVHCSGNLFYLRMSLITIFRNIQKEPSNMGLYIADRVFRSKIQVL